MKKAMYLCLLVFMAGVSTSYAVTSTVAKPYGKHALKQQERVIGYFSRSGNTYEVWGRDEPDGFITVTDVYIINASTLSVTDFRGLVDTGGVARISVTLSDDSNFYFTGRLRTNP